MNLETIKAEIIQPKLTQGEELIGFFIATCSPSFGWYLLLGPLSSLKIKNYYVAVTSLGIQLHKLNLWNNSPENYDFFNYNEITNIKVGNGLLQAPLDLKFSNGRELKLKAQITGVANVAVMDETTKAFLKAKFNQ